MARPVIIPTGREAHFAEEEIIVSKTDLRGIITYANDVFQRVSGFTEAELLGQPHNLIRHPAMPAGVFRLLWDALKGGREIFAYVVNLAKNGDHYWVFAHVTPSFDRAGRTVGYHSNRRVPHPDALPKVKALYARMLAAEQAAPTPQAGMDTSTQILLELLAAQGIDYSQFVFSLSDTTRLAASA